MLRYWTLQHHLPFLQHPDNDVDDGGDDGDDDGEPEHDNSMGDKVDNMVHTDQSR